MKPFVVLTDDQRTDAWKQARVGRLTGTGAPDMLATIKTGEAAARRDLRVRLVVERLTGQSQEDGYMNAAMASGVELEAEAVAEYELKSERIVQPVGFLAHQELMAGCSPDGQVGGFEGIIEVKCPKSATHLDYLKTGRIPTDYTRQIQHNLWITGAQWCDFVSYNSRFPEALRLLIVRLDRDEAQMRAYELAARMFLTEVDNEYAECLKLAAEREGVICRA